MDKESKKNLASVCDYIAEHEQDDYVECVENGEGYEDHIYIANQKLGEKMLGWEHIFKEGTRIVYFPVKDHALLGDDNFTEFSARIDKVIEPFKYYLIVDQDNDAYEVHFKNNFFIE